MLQTDIAIVGGGLAGSTAAAMLGRAGIPTIVIDPHKVYPPDFRCEKLDNYQVGILHKTGLAQPVLDAATLDNYVWIARLGRLLDKHRPSDQNGIFYETLVNTLRDQIGGSASFIEAKATAIKTSNERQYVTLSNGEEISARLVVLANGLNIGLRQSIGIEREIISACHSITIGFNLTPAGRDTFDFPALTYFTEGPATRTAYLTLFPIGSVMRANLMVYRDMDDPWLRRMRHTPEQALQEIMPNLGALTGSFKVEGDIKIRPADLYVTRGHRQAGIVLVGDAFATSCPAAGTGTGRVFTDVERLCNTYIPAWLKTPGMGVLKTSQFYDDPDKRAYDEKAARAAFELRSISIDTSLLWYARRWLRFAVRYGFGLAHTMREMPLMRPSGQPQHGA